MTLQTVPLKSAVQLQRKEGPTRVLRRTQMPLLRHLSCYRETEWRNKRCNKEGGKEELEQRKDTRLI